MYNLKQIHSKLACSKGLKCERGASLTLFITATGFNGPLNKLQAGDWFLGI